jgi:hypothetical protein
MIALEGNSTIGIKMNGDGGTAVGTPISLHHSLFRSCTFLNLREWEPITGLLLFAHDLFTRNLRT